MGDRGNIVIKSDGEQVWFYTHWSGSEIKATLKAALIKAPDHWTDPPYLARVVFQTLIGDHDGTTGFGISTRIGDNEHKILVCDCDTQSVYEVSERSLDNGRLARAQVLDGVSTPFKQFIQ